MNIYEKIDAVKKELKTIDFKKDGYNDYSKYKYFTPEYIYKQISKICENHKVFNKFELIEDGERIFGRLEIINLENIEDKITYIVATKKSEMKATNMTQEMGATLTYVKRYSLQNAYDIFEGMVDMDSNEYAKSNQMKKIKNSKTIEKTKIELLEVDENDNITTHFENILKKIENKQLSGVFNGKKLEGINYIKHYYTLSKELEEKIIKQIENNKKNGK